MLHMDSVFQKSRQQPERVVSSFSLSRLYPTLMSIADSGFFHLTTSRNDQELDQDGNEWPTQLQSVFSGLLLEWDPAPVL